MNDNLEPTSVELKQARQIADAMVPRTDAQREQRDEITQKIFDVMMSMKNPENEFDASILENEAASLKNEAIALAKEMPRPSNVLLFDDCIPLKDVEVITDGEWRIALHEFDSLTVPSGTNITINSVAMLMIILKFPHGLELRLRKEHFPEDGIPIHELPSITDE